MENENVQKFREEEGKFSILLRSIFNFLFIFLIFFSSHQLIFMTWRQQQIFHDNNLNFIQTPTKLGKPLLPSNKHKHPRAAEAQQKKLSNQSFRDYKFFTLSSPYGIKNSLEISLNYLLNSSGIKFPFPNVSPTPPIGPQSVSPHERSRSDSQCRKEKNAQVQRHHQPNAA